jgi:hypothetical protein
MRKIQSFIGKTIANCCHKFNFHHYNIILDWKEIVGKELFAIIEPLALNFPFKRTINGVLSVNILNPAYILQIQAQKPVILQKINGYIGYNAVSELKFLHKATANQGQSQANSYHDTSISSKHKKNAILQKNNEDLAILNSKLFISENIYFDDFIKKDSKIKTQIDSMSHLFDL